MQIAAFLLMAYGFQSIKDSRTFLVVQLSPFPAPSQPQPPTPESQDPYPAPATVPGSLQPQASCCSNFGAGCCQGQALGWLRLAPGGGVRLRSSSGRLQAGWGMRGWAGKKKSKKSQLEKSKKSQKKVKKKSNVRILALADYWRQQKVKKKSKKSRKKVEKKSILLATLGPDRAGYLGLWGGYQGHQGQGWLGAEETLGQWLGLGRGPATLG